MDELYTQNELGSPISKFNKIKKIILLLGAAIFLFLFYFFFIRIPADFPVGTILKIEQGKSLRGVSFQLKEMHFIYSRLVFEAFVILYGGEKGVISSDYYFENKLPVYEVARRISKGEHHMAPISITIPEGFNLAQIADICALNLVNFNKSKFLLEAKELEGYLFPDTYFFLRTDDETDVLHSMRENFEKKITPLLSEIGSHGNTEKEIIIMASVIEREAKGDTDREIISGILWRTLAISMPLQVDAAPETYKTKGLPKNPISSPGLEAIRAAIDPLQSNYLYYLHDKNGTIHYAKNFTEHRANIEKYLSH